MKIFLQKKFSVIFVSFFLAFFSINAISQEIDIFQNSDGTFSATVPSPSFNRLYDNDIRTEYNFNGLPNEIVFKSSKTYAVKKMLLTSSSQPSTKDPKEAELYGSHDGKNWVLLRNITSGGLNFTERKQTITVTVSATQPYPFFKLKIKSVNDGGTNCYISEWRLLGEEKQLSAAPTDLKANALSHDRVNLVWRDRSSDEDGFELQRSSNGKDYSTIANLQVNTTRYSDTLVNAKATYFYRICSMKDRVRSAYCISNNVVTPSYPELTILTSGRSFTSSDQYGTSPVGEDVSCAFDNDTNTKFLARNASAWLRVSFNESYKALQYSITSANDAPGRDPKSWRLEGSNNGTIWTALDSRVNISFSARFQKLYFEIKNPDSYKYYRLNVIANNGDAGLMQLADWLLYADIPVGNDVITPNQPTNFKLENRAYHHVKLSWSDVSNETSYRIERSDDGGQTFNYTYDIPANNTESYPYSLKPETDYVFKLYAVNSDNVSEPATVSVTTAKKEFKERFENYPLWILDKPANFNKVEEIGNTAFYVLEGYTKEDINDLYYDFYAANWNYVFECYGDELSDSCLHVLLIPMEEGGGLASIYDYRSSASFYRNMVYIKANKNWFKNRSESGYIYDVMAHELCHIIEGVGGGYNGSMFYPVWGDSKWAEILQYDIFKALGSSRAASWHRDYTEGVKPGGGADYPDSDRVSYWYRDFLYPTYNLYGKTALLKKFWKLQGQYYKMRNGSFQGNSSNPGGRGNLGELIHFWSAAAGVDVKPFAVKAFGWNEQFEAWLQQAKIDYPELTYDETALENRELNICLNGGVMTSNYSNTKVENFIDNNFTTFYLTRKDNAIPILELTYKSSEFAKINRYVLTFKDNAAPASWKLLGSNDGIQWVTIDIQNNPSVISGKTTVEISSNSAYKFFKYECDFTASGEIKFAEIEIFGIHHPGAPYNLEGKRLSDKAVVLEWSGNIDEISGYEIERSSDVNVFANIANVSKFEVSYFDENLIPGLYSYRVVAVNKNLSKEKVHTNTVTVDTNANGIKTNSDFSNFYQIANNLNKFPQNTVEVYSLTGQKIINESYYDNDLLVSLKNRLTKGIYVVKIRVTKDEPIVSSKFIVQ
ncbi:hypothetical protein MASR2M117_07820 [Paludibacter sp.]